MTIAERLQDLRKAKGISQEELADIVGVSRQAVSKWESGQSTPDLDKIIALSVCYGVTTDYILKGIAPTTEAAPSARLLGGKVCCIAGVALVAIGLMCGIAGWNATRQMTAFWGALVIQAVGLAVYFIGRTLSKERPPCFLTWLGVAALLFMPSTFLFYILLNTCFNCCYRLEPVPQFITNEHALFVPFYLAVLVAAHFALKKWDR